METELSIPLLIGLLLVLGLFTALQVARIGLPRIVGYLLIGVLFSPHLLGDLIGFNLAGWSETLTSITLGIIAYIIGGSMTLNQLRRMGKVIFGSALGESLGAVFAVMAGVALIAPLFGYEDSITLALAMGAIAATTAPAATVAVIHQFRAHGKVCDTLLGVVAIDDAIGILAFSVILALLMGEGLGAELGEIGFEIGGALMLGALVAAILSLYGHHVHQGSLRLPMIIGSILLALGAANTLDVSPILTGMALGFFSRMFMRSAADRMFAPIEYFEELVFAIFFTLAGAHFDLKVIASNIPLVLIYVLFRAAGKIGGAFIGATAAGAPVQTRHWLGFALMPHAGVAVGLALTISQVPQLAHIKVIVMNTIIASTILFALMGPFAVKFSLSRAGELGEKRS